MSHECDNCDQDLPNGVTSLLRINVTDVTEEQWKAGNGVRCLDCKRVFDDESVWSEDEIEDGCQVPLQLFRGEGDATQMLSFCWRCATLRMQNSQGQ